MNKQKMREKLNKAESRLEDIRERFDRLYDLADAQKQTLIALAMEKCGGCKVEDEFCKVSLCWAVQYGGGKNIELAPEPWKCKECGCTDANCSQCVESSGKPCRWVGPNRCSRCFDDDGNLKGSRKESLNV